MPEAAGHHGPVGWGLSLGASNTVLGRHRSATDVTAVAVPGHGRPGGDGHAVPTVPSVIHYADDGRRLVGAEVLAADLLDAAGTVRGMTSPIGRRGPGSVQVGERRLSRAEVVGDFLAAVLRAAGVSDDEGSASGDIALAAPVEAAEDVEEWLRQAAAAAPMPRMRVVDEPSAAAVGYGVPLRPGLVFMLVDCGTTSVRAAVLRVTDRSESAALERRCRVLGSADDDVGGATTDGWLATEMLVRHGPDDLALLDRVLREALRGAAERGYGAEDVTDVLVVGATTLVPAVRHAIERFAGRARVHADRPLDAVARGAAALAVGVGPADRIRHDYALRCYDRARRRYEYRTCVAAGTPYPTDEPVATVVLKASHDGQRELGLAVFELGELRGAVRSELVLDRSGAWRLEPLTSSDEQERTRVWVNEHRPTYLVSDPPARAGEARFRVELGVDADKRLVLTAHDLVTRETVLRDHPVADLR